MKQFKKVAILAALGLVSVSAAQAANFTVNDLYLGFTEGAASSDLIINLGLASSIVGQTSVVDLSSSLTSGASSQFTSLFGSANGVTMAVVGGDNLFGHGDVFGTQVRVGGAGTASVPGSTLTYASQPTSATLTAAANTLTSINLPSSGFTTDASKTYSSQVTLVGSPNNFQAKSGINPDGTLDNTGVLYEDLYSVTPSATTYEGYFTFDQGANTLTFTGANVAAVPEPATYGLLSGAGMLLLGLRRQFARK